MLLDLLKDKEHFLGNAELQIDTVIKKAEQTLSKYSKEASYEPGDIL